MLKTRGHIIVAGVHKGGTTSIFDYLGDHPKVFKPLKKELHFFTPLVYGEKTVSQEEYFAHFSNAAHDQFLLDVSPSYLYGGNDMLEALEGLSNVKAVVILRNPAKRFISFYKQGITTGRIKKTTSLKTFFESALKEFNQFQKDGIQRDTFTNRALREGCYNLYLEDWINKLQKDLSIVYFENFVLNPKTEMESLCHWLEIDSIYDDYNFTVKNASTTPKSQKLSSWASKFFLKYESFFRKNLFIKQILKKIYGNLNRGKSTLIDEEIEKTITQFYEEHNKKLGIILTKYNIEKPDWINE